MSNMWDSMVNAFTPTDSYEDSYGYAQPSYAGAGSLGAQDIADIDSGDYSQAGHGVASAVPQSDILMADSGMVKDKSWMHQGMQAALKGMARMPKGGLGGGSGGASGFAPSGSVSAKGDTSTINEINKMIKGSPPLADLGKYSKLFG